MSEPDPFPEDGEAEARNFEDIRPIQGPPGPNQLVEGIITFNDPFGHEHTLSYQENRTWQARNPSYPPWTWYRERLTTVQDVTHGIWDVVRAYDDSHLYISEVDKGAFEIFTLFGGVVSPDDWESTIRPGAAIGMFFRDKEELNDRAGQNPVER